MFKSVVMSATALSPASAPEARADLAAEPDSPSSTFCHRAPVFLPLYWLTCPTYCTNRIRARTRNPEAPHSLRNCPNCEPEDGEGAMAAAPPPRGGTFPPHM